VREGPLVACRTGGQGLVTATHLAWTSPTGPDVPTPVADDKFVYVLDDRAMLSCFEIDTGKPRYEKQRLPRGTYSASPLLAAGRLYVTSEDAKTTVLAAGPEFKILSENQLDDAYTLSSIAVADDQLFIRTSRHLYCIGARTASQPVH
jgi:outer membrane protein assembly factor BamB